MKPDGNELPCRKQRGIKNKNIERPKERGIKPLPASGGIKKAVVLLSGGIDSTTTLAIAKAERYDLYAISFRYHQRHSREIEAAQKVASTMNVKKHLTFDMDLSTIGGSALTDQIQVPKDRSQEQRKHTIPSTYVPGRNTIFLSIALAWAETLEIADIFIGVNALDYSGYPDCRPEFISAFEKMANLATKTGVEGRSFRIQTPLIGMTKAQIILRGKELGVNYSLTHSCYDPDASGKACGRCDSCLIRKKGFMEAGFVDPAEYVS